MRVIMRRKYCTGWVLAAAVLISCQAPTAPSSSNLRAGDTVGTRSSLAAALTSPQLQAQVRTPRDLLTVNSLIVLPIEFNEKTRSLEAEAPTMDVTLQEAARRELDLKILDRLPRAVDGQVEAVAAARESGADGVLVTRLESYIERSGSAVGGEPGTVSFRMFVLRTSDQREVWSTTYHFRDEALAFNLFKVGDRLGRDGAGFRRAGDVLVEGFASALKDFSTRRQEQFVVKSGR